MYRVYVNDQTAVYPLYEPLDETLRIFEPVLTQEMGQAGYFQFQILTSHPYYDKINLLKSELIVYEDSEVIFYGRLLKPERSMQNMVSITCEGDLTYLIDSLQRPYDFTCSITGFIEQILNVHNSQVDDYKKIYIGNIVVTDNNNYIRRFDSGFSTTLEVLKSKLINIHGGYFRIRNQNEERYLDYLWDYGGINDQVIRFGENLLDMNHYIDATEIITCLIPTGADIEYKDDLGEVQSKGVDITSVNNGVDYIQNDEAVNIFGKVWGHRKWEDVTLPRVLFEKAEKYLEEVTSLPSAIEINAIDLSLVDINVQKFSLGYWTQISSEPHEIEDRFMLTKKVINLLNPTDGSITLGKEGKTLTGTTSKNQSQILETIDKVAESTSSEIKRKVENATALITGGLGGYVVLDNIDPDTGKQMHPWRILIMNTPDKETATNIIQLNQNGLGFSTTGINGPYGNAWTIDGNLIADFITAGTMMADRIKGGVLEVGGSSLAKDGQILVKNSRDKVIVKLNTKGIEVTSGRIDLNHGLFYADDDEVIIGGFKAYDTAHGRYLATADEENGIGAHATYAFWTGWDGIHSSSAASIEQHYGSVITKAGNGHFKTILGSEIYLSSSWYNGWSITRCLRDLYNRVESLEGG